MSAVRNPVLAATVLACLGVVFEPPAQAATREEVLGLVAVEGGGTFGADRWALADSLVFDHQAILLFRCRGCDWDLRVVLEPKDSSKASFATTPSFAISYQRLGFEPTAAVSSEIFDFMKGLAEVVRRNDRGGVFAKAPLQGPPPGPIGEEEGGGEEGDGETGEAGGLTQAASFLLWLDFLLLLFALVPLVLAARMVAADVRKWPRVEACAIGALLLAGWLVRLLVVPRALVTVGMIYPLMEQSIGLAQLPRYGAAPAALYHALFQLLPAHTDSVLVLHAVLSLAGAVVLVALARTLFRDGRVALWTALFVSLTPIFMRDSNSESLYVPGFFFLLVGGLVFHRFLLERKVVNLWGSLPALALALHFRPEFVVVVPLFLASLVVAESGNAPGGVSLPWGKAALFGLALAVLAVPYGLYMVESFALESSRGNFSQGKIDLVAMVLQLLQRNLLIRPQSFPAATSLLALTAVGLAIVRGKNRGAVLMLALSGLAWMTLMYVDFNEESMLRLHVPPAMLFCLVAAAGAAALVELPKRLWRQRAVAGAVALGFLLSAAGTAFFVFFKTNSQVEGALFSELVEALPDERGTFIALTGWDEPGNAWTEETRASEGPCLEGSANVHRFYPSYLLRPPNRQDDLLSIGQWAEKPVFKGRVFFYLGPACYAMREGHGEGIWNVSPDPLMKFHPACRYMLQSYEMRPVKLFRVPNHSEYSPPFKWYAPELHALTIGFLELLGPADPAGVRGSLDRVADGYFSLAKPYLEEGDLPSAERILLAGGEALGQGCPRMWEHLANYYFLAGSEKGDKEALGRALDLWFNISTEDPGYPLLIKNISSVFGQVSGYMTAEEVRQIIDFRLAVSTDDPIGLMLKGMVAFYNGHDYAEALRHFGRVAARVQDDPRVYVYRALCHFYLGNQQEAETLAEKAVEVSQGHDPDAYYARSIVKRQKDLAGAVKDIERYLEASQGGDKVKYPAKEKWLRQELENLRQGKPSPWWRTSEYTEPWKN
jgi:tetratricopeptide (TPR) repeat protein